MSEGFGGMGQYFQQEKMFEKQVAQKILSNMKAVWGLRKDRDRQLDGLLNRIPPPPELVQAKVWLRYRMSMARSSELKRVIAFIIKFVIKPLLDMFQHDPILIDSYFKDRPTSSRERGYIAAPGAMTGHEEEIEEEFVRNMDIAQQSEDDYTGDKTPGSDDFDPTRLGFIGPTDYEAGQLSEDDEDEEDLDL
jgi:hypothetical protein